MAGVSDTFLDAKIYRFWAWNQASNPLGNPTGSPKKVIHKGIVKKVVLDLHFFRNWMKLKRAVLTETEMSFFFPSFPFISFSSLAINFLSFHVMSFPFKRSCKDRERYWRRGKIPLMDKILHHLVWMKPLFRFSKKTRSFIRVPSELWLWLFRWIYTGTEATQNAPQADRLYEFRSKILYAHATKTCAQPQKLAQNKAQGTQKKRTGA